MKSYQNTSFQDRLDQGARSKQRALDQMRAKPPVDPAIVEARQEAARRREEAAAEKRAAKSAAEQAARDEKAAAAAAEAARIAAIKPEKTEAERKLARDERYAARKARR